MHFIIFDVDGTLTNTYYDDDDCYKRALDAVLPDHDLLNYWDGCPDYTDSAVADFVYNRLLKRSPTNSELHVLQNTFVRLLQEKQVQQPAFFNEIDGAGDMLTHLNSVDDLMLGISTGGWHRPAHYKLNTAGINTTGTHFIGSDDHFAKLDFTRALIDRTQSTIGQRFERITYVGDSPYDLKTAQKLGIEFIGIDDKGLDRLKAVGALRVIRNYRDNWNDFLEWLG